MCCMGHWQAKCFSRSRSNIIFYIKIIGIIVIIVIFCIILIIVIISRSKNVWEEEKEAGCLLLFMSFGLFLISVLIWCTWVTNASDNPWCHHSFFQGNFAQVPGMHWKCWWNNQLSRAETRTWTNESLMRITQELSVSSDHPFMDDLNWTFLDS